MTSQGDYAISLFIYDILSCVILCLYDKLYQFFYKFICNSEVEELERYFNGHATIFKFNQNSFHVHVFNIYRYTIVFFFCPLLLKFFFYIN